MGVIFIRLTKSSMVYIPNLYWKGLMPFWSMHTLLNAIFLAPYISKEVSSRLRLYPAAPYVSRNLHGVHRKSIVAISFPKLEFRHNNDMFPGLTR